MSKRQSNHLQEEIEEVVSPIKEEVDKFKAQIKEIQQASDDVRLKDIKDPKEKLNLTLQKMAIMEKLPKLLLALKELTESAVSTMSVRGAQELSLIEKEEI